MEEDSDRLFPRPVLDSDDEDMNDKPWSIHGRDIREPDKDDPNALNVKLVNFNIAANGKSHHTSDYEEESIDRFVVRRGQPFDIDITFSRPYNEHMDDIRLNFKFEYKKERPEPHEERPEPHVDLLLSDKHVEKKWGAMLLNREGKTIIVRIFTPPTLYVGIWKFSLDVIKKIDGKNVVFRNKHAEPIYMLFNPWCKDDQVYMHDEECLEEYILNETGYIYKSPTHFWIPTPGKTRWNFAQFEFPVLECTLYLLDEKSNLSLVHRSDPVMVVRSLSGLANSQDERGVLVGNWLGSYEGGKSPSHWNGSLEILEQYYEQKAPVRYGQCWVYSGILTTLCRTLGIPARSITNLNSAHDTDGNLRIDKYVRKDGSEKGFDSVWNFHVWNDSWMARPDLPEGYGGWQAIDGTPQELSSADGHRQGTYCCGPMSLTAIRRGNVALPYDGPFIFAEVNSDMIKWIEDDDGIFRREEITTKEEREKSYSTVGKMISTNKPMCKRTGIASYDPDREDITHEYKYKEGSPLERLSVFNANSSVSKSSENFYDIKEHDVEFTFEVSEDFIYGAPYEISVKVTNNSKEPRTINGLLSSQTTYYTGVNYAKVKKKHFKDELLGPQKSTTLSLKVEFDEYSKHLIDECCFHHHCMFKVKETRQVLLDEANLALKKPMLALKAPDVVKVGQKFFVEISFTNPLPLELTNCLLSVEGPGIQKARKIIQSNVKARDKLFAKVEMEARKPGKRRILANFNSTELAAVVGDCAILVEPNISSAEPEIDNTHL